MIPLELTALQQFLSQKFDAKIQEETKQIYIIFKIQKYEFPLFIKITEGEHLLQLLLFLPNQTRENSINDLSRLLHFINKEMDIPGFCTNEEANVVFYRVMLPAQEKQISKDVLLSIIESIQTVADTFFPVILAVSEGYTTYQEVVKKVQEAKNE